MFIQASRHVQRCKSVTTIRLGVAGNGERVLSLGKLSGYWLHLVGVAGKRAVVMLGRCCALGRWGPILGLV